MSDGYTHDPDAFEADDGDEADVAAPSDDGSQRDPDPDRPASGQGEHPETAAREFDWRGWTLVAGIVVAFFVIPGIIYLYPHVGPMFGLTFWDTYLVLPMIPAVLLGLLAVWATTRP
jgi:hypothetical protein